MLRLHCCLPLPIKISGYVPASEGDILDAVPSIAVWTILPFALGLLHCYSISVSVMHPRFLQYTSYSFTY